MYTSVLCSIGCGRVERTDQCENTHTFIGVCFGFLCPQQQSVTPNFCASFRMQNQDRNRVNWGSWVEITEDNRHTINRTRMRAFTRAVRRMPTTYVLLSWLGIMVSAVQLCHYCPSIWVSLFVEGYFATGCGFLPKTSRSEREPESRGLLPLMAHRENPSPSMVPVPVGMAAPKAVVCSLALNSYTLFTRYVWRSRLATADYY